MTSDATAAMAPAASAADRSAPLFDWLSTRGAGVLLHPTSLPGAQGIGVLDGAALRFLDFLEAAHIKYWQICPLGPTGYGDSPYQCFSAFAGNPYLIDLAALAERGLLTAAELAPLASLPAGAVDYGAIFRLKVPLLRTAYDRHQRGGSPDLDAAQSFADFKLHHAHWLDAYAWFRALKDHHGGRPWWEWPAPDRSLATVDPALRTRLLPEADAHRFYQYVFFAQWRRLHAEAERRGIELIGDIPIFVAADSADTWAHPELFELGPDGRPTAVAGVPPDYFSADGQLWGNPLYRWEAHAADGYAWWCERLRSAFELSRVLRIDHFRGFDAYWSVPFPAPNARTGEWRAGPGADFFRAVRAAFPAARIIAEDLGVLTPSVVRLREASGLPGMAVLQFAFGGEATNLYLPHNLTANGVVYSGTHDNDTTAGWYASAPEPVRDHVRRYLRVDGGSVSWDFIRAAYASVSRLAIVPMQDLLGLGTGARFNSPGVAQGNWQWRLSAEALERLIAGGTAAYLADLARLYGRAEAGARVTSRP
jgi:4-alpha-glucanotransferase